MGPLPKKWAKVAAALEGADSVAFDGCHKIYVLLDREQTALMRNYPHLVTVAELGGPEKALRLIRQWYSASCELRFVSAVRTTPEPNDGFADLIPQFA